MRKLNRIAPKMPTQNYQTFAIRKPFSTHYRHATCEEIGCEAFLHGWQLHLESLPPDLVYAAKHSGRKFREYRMEEGETYLIFEPGQSCFAESTHVISLDRPEFYFVGRGDHRSFSTRRAQQFNSADWVDVFATHLDRIRTEQAKG